MMSSSQSIWRDGVSGLGEKKEDDFEDDDDLTGGIPGSIEGVPGYVITRLEDSAKEYELQFEQLLVMLKEQVIYPMRHEDCKF